MFFSSLKSERNGGNCCLKESEFSGNMTMISIEGNIAVGKTTLLDKIDTIMKDRASTSPAGKELLQTIREPVDEWMLPRAIDNGKSRLELVYEDPKNHTASFQKGVLDDLPKAFREGFDSAIGNIIITERSVGCSLHVFCVVHHEYGNITFKEYSDLVHYFYNGKAHNYMPNAVVYLRSTPELCYERIKLRGRSGEEDITLKYLQDLNQAHEDWIKCYAANEDIVDEISCKKVCRQKWVKPLILDVTTEEYNTTDKVASAVIQFALLCNNEETSKL
jgi:deoxyadenosine/deoxycytidine kinase